MSNIQKLIFYISILKNEKLKILKKLILIIVFQNIKCQPVNYKRCRVLLLRNQRRFKGKKQKKSTSGTER